jgi:hypothetical protein
MHNKKETMMKTHSLSILLSCLCLFILTACDEKVNDWDVEPGYERLFRPTSFTTSTLQPTSVELGYFGVADATKYVFEFSEGDSLQFNNITKTIEIQADTLTPYDEAETIVETQYRTWFENLKGTTRYSVRMKAISTTSNMESGYSQLYFVTPNEQIFTGSTPSLDKAIVSWIAGVAVTHIVYRNNANEEEQTLQLSDQQKAEGQATITGLSPGASYTAVIYNEDARRGEVTFRTLGIPSDEGRYVRLTSDDAIFINDILNTCATEGAQTVVLVCEGSQVYEFATITIPAGIDKLYFVGNLGAGGILPELFLHRINLSSLMTSLSFQKIDLNARLNSSNYVFDIGGTSNWFQTIDFEGCIIRNIGRSLVRPNNANIDIEAIRFNNCTINNVGVSGYGFINMGVDVVNIGLISLTNSTVTEIGSDRLFHLKGGVKQVVVDKITLCNYESKSGQVFRFDTQPGSITVSNSIFGGTNGGSKINAGNSNYTYLEFYGCFITADLVVNTIPFANATTLSMTSEELFADPRNGDFHLKAGVRYPGEGKAGDPQWW